MQDPKTFPVRVRPTRKRSRLQLVVTDDDHSYIYLSINRSTRTIYSMANMGMDAWTELFKKSGVHIPENFWKERNRGQVLYLYMDSIRSGNPALEMELPFEAIPPRCAIAFRLERVDRTVILYSTIGMGGRKALGQKIFARPEDAAAFFARFNPESGATFVSVMPTDVVSFPR